MKKETKETIETVKRMMSQLKIDKIEGICVTINFQPKSLLGWKSSSQSFDSLRLTIVLYYNSKALGRIILQEKYIKFLEFIEGPEYHIILGFKESFLKFSIVFEVADSELQQNGTFVILKME